MKKTSQSDIGKIIERFQKSDKKKPAQVLVGFLIIMLILGMISRGIYAYMLPRVNTVAPSRGSIVHTIIGEGVVEAKDYIPVNVIADIRVAQIMVEKGSTVARGEPLLKLEQEEMNQQLDDLKDEIAILEMEIEDQNSAAFHNAQVNGLNDERADEDYALFVSQAQLNLNVANNALETAQQASMNRISRDAYIQECIGQNGSVIAAQMAVHELESAGVKDSSYDDALEYMDMMIYIARQNAEDAYDAETDRIQQEINEARQKVEETELEVQAALLDATREVEDAALVQVTNHNAEIKEIQLQNLLEEQLVYEEMISQNGIVYSPEAGVIDQIAVTEGSNTTSDAAFVIALTEGTFTIQAPITEENCKYVAVGDNVSILFPGSGSRTEDAVLDKIILENEQNYVVISLDASNAQIGEIGEYTIESVGVTADVTIPIQALHSDGVRYFVWVIERKNTILGEEITATMRIVSVGEKNERIAELLNSGLSSDSEVIVASDKEIGDAMTVRMAEQ